MAKRTQMARGIQTEVVPLLVAEFGFVTDNDTLIIGTSGGNTEVVTRINVEVTKNIFNKNAIQADSAINLTTGAIDVGVTDWNVSEPIAVTAGQDYVLQGIVVGSKGIRYENASHVLVSFEEIVSSTAVYNIPAGASYAVFTTNTASDGQDLDLIQFELGVIPTQIVPYGEVVTGIQDIPIKPADPVVEYSLLDAIDFPDSYLGESGKYAKVKSSEDGIEFVDVPNIGHNPLSIHPDSSPYFTLADQQLLFNKESVNYWANNAGLLTYAGNVIITGDLTVIGSSTETVSGTVEISDNLGIINAGEVGAGVTAGFAGWEVDRGTLDNYRWGFDEINDEFVLGKITGTLRPVLTRSGTFLEGNIAIWNEASNSLVGVTAGSLASKWSQTNGNYYVGEGDLSARDTIIETRSGNAYSGYFRARGFGGEEYSIGADDQGDFVLDYGSDLSSVTPMIFSNTSKRVMFGTKVDNTIDQIQTTGSVYVKQKLTIDTENALFIKGTNVLKYDGSTNLVLSDDTSGDVTLAYLKDKVNSSRVLTDVPADAIFTDNVYEHPVNHPPSIISQDLNNRFVTDAQVTNWNGKVSADAVTYELLDANGDVGTLAGQLAIGSHGHANMTVQGNAFNGVSQLVKLDAVGKLPAVDGSALINIPGVSVDTSPTNGSTIVAISSDWAYDHAIGETVNLHTKVGTINAGIWQGTAIDDSYIASASDWNALVSNATHTGEVTGSAELTITDGVITTDKLAARYKTQAPLASTALDWSAAQSWSITLASNATWTFVNLHLGVKDIECTGDFTLAFPAYVKIISGEYDGTVANLIQFKCVNAGGGSESIWTTISQEAI